MAMDMEDEQARATFHKMAEMMWLIGSRNQKQLENTGTEPVEKKNSPEPESLEEPMLESQEEHDPSTMPMPPAEKETLPIQEKTEPEIVEVSEAKTGESTAEPVEPKMISSGYGGFLYIRCPVCGKVKGFCAKTRLNNFRCECGSVTRLEHLVPLYMNCECGRNSKYLTNMEEPAFDIKCYDCGNPVAVAWQPKKKQYETIR